MLFFLYYLDQMLKNLLHLHHDLRGLNKRLKVGVHRDILERVCLAKSI